jgi:hypothetical protein
MTETTARTITPAMCVAASDAAMARGIILPASHAAPVIEAALAATPPALFASDTIAAAEAAHAQGRDAFAAWWNAANRDERLCVIDNARHLLAALSASPAGWRLVPEGDVSALIGGARLARYLIDIIEGPFGWATCRSEHGMRLKDAPEYVAAYLGIKEAFAAAEAIAAAPPAPAAAPSADPQEALTEALEAASRYTKREGTDFIGRINEAAGEVVGCLDDGEEVPDDMLDELERSLAAGGALLKVWTARKDAEARATQAEAALAAMTKERDDWRQRWSDHGNELAVVIAQRDVALAASQERERSMREALEPLRPWSDQFRSGVAGEMQRHEIMREVERLLKPVFAALQPQEPANG